MGDNENKMLKSGQIRDVKTPDGNQTIFASYYWSDVDSQKQGFGNIVLAVNIELYKNKIAQLILDLQKQLKIIIDEQQGVDSNPQVLYFR